MTRFQICERVSRIRGWITYVNEFVQQLHDRLESTRAPNWRGNIRSIWIGINRKFDAAHCSTLQQTAAHCSTMQHTSTDCNRLPQIATHCNTLQGAATHCNTLQHTAPNHRRNVKSTWIRANREFYAAHCNALPNTASHCNTLQHTAPNHTRNVRSILYLCAYVCLCVCVCVYKFYLDSTRARSEVMSGLIWSKAPTVVRNRRATADNDLVLFSQSHMTLMCLGRVYQG
jgi:hypothetical protein